MHMKWDSLIKHYRHQYCLTQREVADLLGVSQKTVSRWESAENVPSIAQQRQLRDLFREPSNIVSNMLSFAVKTCPAPRALCIHQNSILQALSQPAIAKRPSMVNWMGCSLVPIASGILIEMLDNHALQRSIEKGEIACITSVTRSVFRTPEHPAVGTYRTAITFFRIDGTLFRDAISLSAPQETKCGYWPVPMDEIVSG